MDSLRLPLETAPVNSLLTPRPTKPTWASGCSLCLRRSALALTIPIECHPYLRKVCLKCLAKLLQKHRTKYRVVWALSILKPRPYRKPRKKKFVDPCSSPYTPEHALPENWKYRKNGSLIQRSVYCGLCFKHRATAANIPIFYGTFSFPICKPCSYQLGWHPAEEVEVILLSRYARIEKEEGQS